MTKTYLPSIKILFTVETVIITEPESGELDTTHFLHQFAYNSASTTNIITCHDCQNKCFFIISRCDHLLLTHSSIKLYILPQTSCEVIRYILSICYSFGNLHSDIHKALSSYNWLNSDETIIFLFVASFSRFFNVIQKIHSVYNVNVNTLSLLHLLSIQFIQQNMYTLFHDFLHSWNYNYSTTNNWWV